MFENPNKFMNYLGLQDPDLARAGHPGDPDNHLACD